MRTLRINATNRARAIAIATVAPLLATGALVPTSPAAAAPSATEITLAQLRSAYPGFTAVDSSPKSTKKGIAGQVLLRATNKTVGEGAVVLVYEWPSRSKIAKQKVNTSLPLTPLAVTSTTPSGDFFVPSSAVGKKGGSGKRDLIAMLAGDSTAFQEFEVNSQGESTEANSASPSALAIPAGGASPTVSGTVQAKATILASRAPAPLNGVAAMATNVPCQRPFTTLRQTWDQTGIAGHTKSTTTKVNATLKFSKNASSELGWGASASGGAATYKQSGTKSLSTTTTVTFPTQKAKHDIFFESYWKYGRYEIQAYCGYYYPGALTTLGWEVKPMDFSGGATSFKGAMGNATYCTPYMSGSTFEKENASAMAWSNGVDINTKYVDAGLSAKSGWSHKVSIKYSFARGGGSVCGSHAKPGATSTSPGDLMAK
jgi:hypothetical protein